MKFLCSLLLASFALAAPGKKFVKNPEPLWELSFSGAQPTAVYFDVTSGTLLVSLKEKSGGRIASVTIEGKVKSDKLAGSKGGPGALRSFDGRIYWISGSEVESFGEGGVRAEGKVPPGLGDPVELAVDRGATVFVGTTKGELMHFADGEAVRNSSGLPVTGLFLLNRTLYVLRGHVLHANLLPGPKRGWESESSVSFPLCKPNCRGLEHTSRGDWLTVTGSQVVRGKSAKDSGVLYSANPETEIGRLAYVYKIDPKDDFYVLPFPGEGLIRAFRMNPALK